MGDVLRGTNPTPSYLQICQKRLEFSKDAIGEKRPSSLLLSGLQFYVLRTFGGTAAAVARNKQTKSSTTSQLEKWIHDLGGTFLTKYNAETNLQGHSKTVNCLLC